MHANLHSYPWEQVVQAAYRKYPNPYNPSVVGTDVVERDVSCGKITTKKLIATVWNLPSLVTKVDSDVSLPMIELICFLDCRELWFSVWK